MDGIRKVIEEECEVAGTATNGRDAITAAAEYSPDVMLMDIALPQLNGLDAARMIKRANPNIRDRFRNGTNEPGLCTRSIRGGRFRVCAETGCVV